jgi:thiamine kinase-like enzyme
MTDIAIRWVHNAISTEEFRKLLKKIFYFVDSRKAKTISKEEYIKISNSLYLDKIDERIDSLKKHKQFQCFAEYIKSSTIYNNIEEIVAEYKRLYNEIIESMNVEYISVIGHGDLCFSNMLYNKETSTLKLIDTKGALEESQIWTNPYYDIAKLSHSICGKYDFFNSGMYDIKLNSDLKFELTIDFDNSAYIEIFKEYLEKSGYNYKMIRLLEASLFLSMLPLHMDFPQKVFGFLLNAINILEEVKNV